MIVEVISKAFDNWDEPKNWMEFADHILWVLGPFLIAIVPTILTLHNRKAIKENHDTLKEVKNQVSNGHADPLRTDLDRVIVMVNDIARNVGEIREDLAEERTSRRSAISDLREDVSRVENYVSRFKKS